MGRVMIKKVEKTVSETAHASCGKCWRDKACLKEDGAPMCRALRLITNDYTFVQDGRFPGCPNHITFGADSHVCCCSIRNELYRKYEL